MSEWKGIDEEACKWLDEPCACDDDSACEHTLRVLLRRAVARGLRMTLSKRPLVDRVDAFQSRVTVEEWARAIERGEGLT